MVSISEFDTELLLRKFFKEKDGQQKQEKTELTNSHLTFKFFSICIDIYLYIFFC